MTGAAALAIAPIRHLRPVAGEGVAAILSRALELGLQERGKPYSGPIVGQPDSYRYGNPGYDCSSFGSEMHERASGLNLYSWAYTDTIARECRRLDPSEVLPGDFVHWHYVDPTQPTTYYPHMGLVYDLARRQTLDCRFSEGRNVGIRSFLNVSPENTHFFRSPTIERLGGATVLLPERIASACHCPPDAVREHWPSIEKALRERSLLTKPIAVAAAATTAIETAHRFRPIHEFRNADGSIPAKWHTYDGGPLFHGRGFIQLTHRSNYADAERSLGIAGLAANPDLALDPWNAGRIMAWFFEDRGVAAAAERGDWQATRRIVLGALGESYPTYKAYIDRLLAG